MISIIINTKNEEKNITRCLASVKNQSERNFEIIVVDNNSEDKTKSLTQNFDVRIFDFGPERSEQKNFGAQQARGEYLLFLDADMELAPGVLSACLAEVGSGFDALVVPEISIGRGFWASCRALEKKMYFNDSEIEAPRFFRKAVFQKVGGYSEGMVAGEDWDLRERVKKSGGRIGRISDLVYHHEGEVSLFRSLGKKFYYGKNAKNYLSQNKPDLLRFMFRPSFWRNAKYVLIDPVHFLGVLFMKSLEFGAGFAGMVYSKFL